MRGYFYLAKELAYIRIWPNICIKISKQFSYENFQIYSKLFEMCFYNGIDQGEKSVALNFNRLHVFYVLPCHRYYSNNVRYDPFLAFPVK